MAIQRSYYTMVLTSERVISDLAEPRGTKFITSSVRLELTHGSGGSILNFVARLQRPSVSEVAEDIKAFRVIDEAVFVGYIDVNDAEATQAFRDIAERYREEFTFGLVTDPEIIETENVKSPTVVCHVPGDGDTRPFTAFAEPGELEKFILEGSRPVIGEMMPYNQQRLLDVSQILEWITLSGLTKVRSVVGP